MNAVEHLLAGTRRDGPRRLGERERRVEARLAAAVALAAVACALASPAPELLLFALCVAAYAATARVRLYVGGGGALATQLAFVPMWWLLPVGAIPLAVLAGLLLSAAADVALDRAPAERLLTRATDAGYAFGPVLVLAAAGGGDPAWPIVLAAFAAQCVADAALSVVREWTSRGIRPRLQLDVMRTVFGVDALLLPVGVVLAHQAAERPATLLAVLPMALVLAGVARDRNRRLDDALRRLGDVERERERVEVAVHRVGRSLGHSLDREAVLEVALGTAVDAVDAAWGRARLAGAAQAMTFEAEPGPPAAAPPAALLAAERAALAGHPAPEATVAGWHAVGRPLSAGGTTLGAVAVCREDRVLTRKERDLFAYLVAQTAASIHGIDLHERLRGRMEPDAVTGLAHAERFDELLRSEVPRANAAELPLSVVVAELDGSRPGGDAVLRAVGDVVRSRCRTTDEPARLGPDRIAVALPDAGSDAARLIAEDLRTGIGALRLPAAGGAARVTASVGVAELSSAVPTAASLLDAATSAAALARAAGGDRVTCHPLHQEEAL